MLYHPPLLLFIIIIYSNKLYNFRKCNFEGISYLLDSVNFTEIFENNDLDENVELFYSILSSRNMSQKKEYMNQRIFLDLIKS